MDQSGIDFRLNPTSLKSIRTGNTLVIRDRLLSESCVTFSVNEGPSSVESPTERVLYF